MKKRMLMMLILLGILFGGLYAWKSFEGKMIAQYMGSMGSQPQTVSTAKARSEEWQTIIEAVGSLRAVRGVDISSEVPGLIEGIYFESGEQVEANTLLVKLRVDDDIANLAFLQAEANLASLTYERDYKQLKEKTVAQATVDISIANLEKAKASVAQQEAVIAKKMIRAPFAGRLGIRLIDLGQYTNAGTNMVTLQALDPIYFDFYLPQQDLAQVKLGQQVSLTSNLYPGKKYIGKVWAINSKVDQNTRNVLVRSVINNAEKELLPGMYGVVNISIGASTNYITLPQTAITYNPYGDTVFVVKQVAEGDEQKLIAEQKFVVLGPTRGDQVAILKGLEDGTEVVSAGQIKLQNGSPIVINNAVLPLNEIDPTPSEYN